MLNIVLSFNHCGQVFVLRLPARIEVTAVFPISPPELINSPVTMKSMTSISGFERSQILLLPEAVDDVGADNPVRFIDVLSLSCFRANLYSGGRALASGPAGDTARAWLDRAAQILYAISLSFFAARAAK
jgi:hypothetical protein